MDKTVRQLNLTFSCAKGGEVLINVRNPKDNVDGTLLHEVAQKVVAIGALSDTKGNPVSELTMARMVRKKWEPVFSNDSSSHANKV